MNESRYLGTLQTLFNTHNFYVWKIHDRFTHGIPDLYIAANDGKSLWIEVKYRPSTPTRKCKPKLSTQQSRWLMRHFNMGHAVAVIEGYPKGHSIFTHGSWDTPQLPQLLNQCQLVHAINHLLD